MGEGGEPIPPHQDIIQLGFQQEQAKLDAYAAATVLCQPSFNESFSIVIMESWLAHVPVLVHGSCDVTRHHVCKSRGGLYFSTYDDFMGAVDWFLANPDLRGRMGQNGWRYVTSNYNWDAVVRRFEAALARWQFPSTLPERKTA
jgi:glycosyltransferase involved in cell wall biosynthesis